MKSTFKYFLENRTVLGTLARFQRERQLRKKMRRWEKSGSQLHMPNLGNQRVVREYINKFSPDIFIETGTYKGKMVYAVMPHIIKKMQHMLDHSRADEHVVLVYDVRCFVSCRPNWISNGTIKNNQVMPANRRVQS